MITKDFVTGGKSIFTIECPKEWAATHNAKDHYTFRVNGKEAKGGGMVYFVSILSGPQNEYDYTYLGILNVMTGQITLTAKSGLTAESMPVRLFNRTMGRIFNNDTAPIVAAGFDCKHNGRCARCARLLTVPSSLISGFGPECIKYAAA